ncbi:MAG TPA: methyltransferase type 11 [Porticoccaceae bacterium]|nr:methyltransferase type 11 [Porticoccaceae bacterium]
MSSDKKGQITQSAAEIYESFFVPALFEAWPPRLADIAGIQKDWHTLDVACGTGTLARHLATRTGHASAVSGVDINPDMLSIARAKNPNIDWRLAPAEQLPFPDECFDGVFSQFGLMFFNDPARAIQEMHRVLRPGGKLVVAVWDALENSPGYSALATLLQAEFGTEVARELHAPYRLGVPGSLSGLLEDAGIDEFHIGAMAGTAVFKSLEDWMHTEIKGWTLADSLNDAQFDTLLTQAHSKLQAFVGQSGSVSFPAPALVAHTVKAPS